MRSQFALAGIIAFVAAFTSVPGRNQEPSAATGVAVQQVVQEIADALNDLVHSLDVAVGNNLFRTRQHLELLIGRIKATSLSTIGLTFDELSEAERSFFDEIQTQVRTLQDLERATISDVQRVTTSLSSAVANLPFAGNLPLVFGSSPLYVPAAELESRKAIAASITGALLAAEDPDMRIDGVPCERER